MSGALPVLSRDYPTQCGWLYGAYVPREGWGGEYSPASLTLMHFRPIPLGATLWDGDVPEWDDEDPAYACDSCERSDVPLWSWSDVWAGGVDISGVECEACIRRVDTLDVGMWVPSPLALPA